MIHDVRRCLVLRDEFASTLKVAPARDCSENVAPFLSGPQAHTALSVSINEPHSELRGLFDEALFRAAERLVDEGRVTELRVLNAGGVVTGVVHEEAAGGANAKRRVYIRRASSAARPEGECSCGVARACTHVAAVLIAAAANASSNRTANERHAPVQPRVGSHEQRLYYVFNAPTLNLASAALDLSIWVAQSTPGKGVAIQSACLFSPRASGDTADTLPRYVDAADKRVLQCLPSPVSPLTVPTSQARAVLQLAVATGRAYWRSLEGRALRAGGTRSAHLEWTLASDGTQRMRLALPATMHVLLDTDPPLYIDAITNECGALELPCPLEVFHRYVAAHDIEPQDVESINARIAMEVHAEALPRLREIAVRTHEVCTPRPRLHLRDNGSAELLFVYGEIALENGSLPAGVSSVRRMHGDCLFEITRDLEAERQHLERIEAVLPKTQQDAAGWLSFMFESVPALERDGWDILIDAQYPHRLALAGDWCADVQANDDDWFDLRLCVTVDGELVNLLPALVDYLQGDLHNAHSIQLRTSERVFVRLDDGRFLPIAVERIQRIAQTLVELLDADALTSSQALKLPASQASRIAQVALDLERAPLQSNRESLRALIEQLRNFSGIEPLQAPPRFRATLRPYQQEGLGWLQFLRRTGLGGILADDMGLGKTVQTLAHLLIEKQQGRLAQPALIVSPVSVLGNWREEIRRFAPDLLALVIHGPNRKHLFAGIDRADVVITGYQTLMLDSEAFLRFDYSVVILDEAQVIKNARTNVAQAARALRARQRLCLTGTPMENHLGELWSLFEFLQPGLLGSERQFQRQYRMPIEKHGDRARAAALSRRIAPFVLRRTKGSVASDLPPRTQIVEHIELDERQRDFYDGIRLAMHRRVLETLAAQGHGRSRITLLDALLKLRQACCDPRLVSDDAETRAIPSAKLEWLIDKLPEFVASGRRILLFSQFTSMLRLIEAVVRELGIDYCLLTGETRERTALVERFQTGAIPLFLISLKAGGVGLNLTAADVVIHFDPWWNPAAEAQATDRAHRIGQQQPVFVYKLIAEGTVEEKILQLQADKHALASQLYGDENALPTRLTAEDLEALFAP